MKNILLVLCMLLSFQNLQAQVDDDDPYLSPLYLSVIYQFSKLNSTNVGLALQGYLLDGRIQLSGSFAHSFYPVDYLMPDNASDFFRNLKYLNGAEIAGNPNGMFYETEFGIVYNFKRSVKTTNSRIPLFSTGTRDFHTTYYTRGDVSSIKMSGIRFGWGQYRRPTIEPMNGYKLEPNPPVTDPTVITLVTERYFNLGVQSTRVVNYAVEGGLPERRATRLIFYTDLLFRLGSRFSDVEYLGQTYQCTTVDNDIYVPVGYRFGFFSTPVRYFKPSFGAEFGVAPTHYDNYQYATLNLPWYGKFSLILGFTYPFKKIYIPESN